MSTADRPEPRIETWPPTRHPSVAPPSLREGALFAGRYRIVEELGRGGMGVVSRARDTRLPRDVAIKVPLHLADPEAIRRFRQEAEAAAMLEHPNICRVLDVGESDGLPFIVLSFIRGRTLADVMRRRKLGAYQAARLVRSVARTIAFAHEGGIAHRDLKPANLMIGHHREPIVMDFGLARLLGQERGTRTGQVFGTLPYMSPEQVRGQAGLMGKGCDIYTLGVIFYELLTGYPPFRGPAWDVARQIVDDDPSPPSSSCPLVDPAFDAIVSRAMAKEIGRRFGSMTEFAEAIEGHLRRVDPRSSHPIVPPPCPARAIPSRPGPSRRTPPRVGTSPGGFSCLASGLILAAGLLASRTGWDRRPDAPGPAETGPPIPARTSSCPGRVFAPVVVTPFPGKDDIGLAGPPAFGPRPDRRDRPPRRDCRCRDRDGPRRPPQTFR